MDKKTMKVKKVIEKIIEEHNKIWADISIGHRDNHAPVGYNCFELKEENIIIIVNGLIRNKLIR